MTFGKYIVDPASQGLVHPMNLGDPEVEAAASRFLNMAEAEAEIAQGVKEGQITPEQSISIRRERGL